ncbi:MAG: L,D-transpeptidase family protein [Patescibacteria group bacterium]
MKKEYLPLGIFRYTFLITLCVMGGGFAFTEISNAETIPQSGIYNASGDLIQAFPKVSPYSSVAVGDINNDGKDEIVIGSAPGVSPSITAYTLEGDVVWTRTPYSKGMTAGLNIAVGDLTGFGNVEVVSVPRRGAGSQIMRFDGATGEQLAPGFFAFSPKFHGGANLAIGDVNGDGGNEIVVGAGPGSTHITFFEYDGTRIGNVFPYGDVDGKPAPWGAVVATIDVDQNGVDEIIVGPQNGHVADIKIFTWRDEDSSFVALGKFEGGVSLSTNDSGGRARVLIGAGSGGGPHVVQYDLNTHQLSGVNMFPFPDSWRDGVTVAFVRYTEQVEFFAIPGANYTKPKEIKEINEPGKVVIVDLSEQRLYAYQDGVRVNSYLVSTGLPGMDTRIGRFAVSQKQYSKLYSGYNFYLPNTLYNLRFDGPRWLHGAYWHNDFGRRKSHGCVNIAYPNAEWLFNWAPVGTTVIVRQ